MSYLVGTTASLGSDHKVTVTFTLPDDVPPCEVDIVATIKPKASKKMTAVELANSEFFGDWADRDDLPKTNEESIEWRRKLWERPRDRDCSTPTF